MTFDPETDLKLERTLVATPDQVWRCWTEADLLKQWFAPKPVETVDAVIDPTPGGRFYTLMRVPEHGDMAGDGCILVAERARRLVWTNALGPAFRPVVLEGGGFTFSADITFQATDTGCAYTIIVRHAQADSRAQHDAMGFHDGWGTAASQMEQIAQSL